MSTVRDKTSGYWNDYDGQIYRFDYDPATNKTAANGYTRMCFETAGSCSYTNVFELIGVDWTDRNWLQNLK